MENFAFFLHFVFVVVVIIVAICFVSDIRKWTTSESIENGPANILQQKVVLK